jgi:hypothetical protein
MFGPVLASFFSIGCSSSYLENGVDMETYKGFIIGIMASIALWIPIILFVKYIV